MVNDTYAQGILPLLKKYCSLMVENDITMNIADIMSRASLILSAADDNTKNSAELFLKRIIEGKLGVIGETPFLVANQDKSLSINNIANCSNTLTDLIEYHQYLKASFYNELGLQSNYNMKREAINSNESQLNEDMLHPFIDDMLRERQEGLDKVNKMFGTDITVRFNSAWEINEREEEAAKKEIIRRYYQETNNYKMGLCDEDTFKKIKLLMNELDIDETFLDVIKPALEKSRKENTPVISMKIGRKIITGKQTNILSPAGSLILNAMKELTKIPDDIDLLSPNVLEPMLNLKHELKTGNRLTLPEILTALSICSTTNPIVEKAINNLKKIKGCEAHATYIVDNGDKKTLKSLKINLTCEPEYMVNDEYNFE
mgnify:CR=1 FL=1